MPVSFMIWPADVCVSASACSIWALPVPRSAPFPGWFLQGRAAQSGIDIRARHEVGEADGQLHQLMPRIELLKDRLLLGFDAGSQPEQSPARNPAVADARLRFPEVSAMAPPTPAPVLLGQIPGQTRRTVGLPVKPSGLDKTMSPCGFYRVPCEAWPFDYRFTNRVGGGG